MTYHKKKAIHTHRHLIYRPTNPMDQPNAQAMTTSLAPAQISLPPAPHPQSSYAMTTPAPQYLPNAYTRNYTAQHQQPIQLSPTNPRKRRIFETSGPVPVAIQPNPPTMNFNKVPDQQDLLRQINMETGMPQQQQQPQQALPDTETMPPPAKKSRVNTPWTPAEEQKLKELRDQGQSWNEIAKVYHVSRVAPRAV